MPEDSRVEDATRRLRSALLDVVRQFGNPEIQALSTQPVTASISAQLVDLTRRKRFTSRDGEATFHAAILLAIAGDESAAPVLRDVHTCWTTNSAIEELHAAAALALLGEMPTRPHFINESISPRVLEALGALRAAR